ncbi:MAG: VWA domain-containing protein [Desulfobacteraceae bacterium]|nr:VWA domain-containing protein [Desulfobacteraceae bacterium]
MKRKYLKTCILVLFVYMFVFAQPAFTHWNKNILIGMDASGSVGSSNWNSITSFVGDLVNTFNRENSEVTWSITLFSSNVLQVHSFYDDQSLSALADSINSINYYGGFTHTDDWVRDTIIQFSGLIPYEERIAILITDAGLVGFQALPKEWAFPILRTVHMIFAI